MPRRRNRKRGERITERDLEVLEFVVRFGVVPRSAVAVWAKTGRSVTFDRERRLREAGLIEVHPAFGAGGSVAGGDPTQPAGLRAGGAPAAAALSMDRPPLDHRRRGGRAARARRRAAALRARDRRRRAIRGGADLLGRAGRSTAGLSSPRSDPARPAPEAIEVELTNKAPARLDALLRGWRRALGQRKVGRVVYLCPPNTLRSVERARKRIRAEDFERLIVQPLTLDHIQLPRPESHDSGGLGDGCQGPSARPPSGVDSRAAAATVAARPGRGSVRS